MADATAQELLDIDLAARRRAGRLSELAADTRSTAFLNELAAAITWARLSTSHESRLLIALAEQARTGQGRSE